MTKKLRAGLIGGGLIGKFHTFMIGRAARAGKLPFEMGLAFDVDETKFPVLRDMGWEIAGSANEVCEASDLVWICVPTAHHKPLVEIAVAHGCAVFCEKPLGRNLTEAREIGEIVGDRPAQVGLVLRTAPPFRVAKEAMARIGEVQAISFIDDQFVPVQKQYASGWRADPELAGSGVLLEHSIHDVDLINWLAGPVNWVDGETGSFLNIAPGIEDMASLQMGLAGGGVASLNTTWHNVTGRESSRHIQILGTEGVIVIRHEVQGPVEIHLGETSEVLELGQLFARMLEIEPGWYGESDLLEHVCNEDARFVRAVVEKTPPTPSIEEALQAHRIVQAGYDSARTGERVSLS